MTKKGLSTAEMFAAIAAAVQLAGAAAILSWAQHSPESRLIDIVVPLSTMAVVAMLAVWAALAKGGLVGRIAFLVCALAVISLALDGVTGAVQCWKSLLWMTSAAVVAALLLLRGAGLRLELPTRGASPRSHSGQFTLLDLLWATLAAGILMLIWQQPWSEPGRGSPFLLAQSLTYPVAAVCAALLCLWPDARPIDVVVRPLMLPAVSLATAWMAIPAINGLRTDLGTLTGLMLVEGALAAIPFLVARACGVRLEWSAVPRRVPEPAAKPAVQGDEA
jgi:hypothetical protein